MSDQTVIRREFPAELEAGDGRTVDVRIVPYGKPAEVSDGGPVYREEWVDGAFDDQLVAGHRLQVLLNFEHERGIGGVIGNGVSLRSQPDGLHGSFEILDGEDGDKALDLVTRGKLARRLARGVREEDRAVPPTASSAASKRICGTSPCAATRPTRTPQVLAVRASTGHRRGTATDRHGSRARRALPAARYKVTSSDIRRTPRNGHPRTDGHLRRRHPPAHDKPQLRRSHGWNTE